MYFAMSRDNEEQGEEGREARENEDYFGCIDRNTGTKVHVSSMLFRAALFSERWVPESGNRRLSVIEL